eukprot:357678-Chlamydomonas_euryale.AAC.13
MPIPHNRMPDNIWCCVQAFLGQQCLNVTNTVTFIPGRILARFLYMPSRTGFLSIVPHILESSCYSSILATGTGTVAVLLTLDILG